MKQAILGFGFFMMTILTVLIVMALAKENTEQNILEQSVEVAVYQSLQEGIDIQEDPGNCFAVNLEQLIDGDTINITIIESNLEKGILSVMVEKEFENFGNERSIQVIRTVIWERT